MGAGGGAARRLAPHLPVPAPAARCAAAARAVAPHLPVPGLRFAYTLPAPLHKPPGLRLPQHATRV